ncbi:MAG: phage holin family protein [Clostridium sp.]|nr:phage holin family protein [Clostridium sp.]
MKDFLNRHPKLKNPYFWLSAVALIFSASGVDFNQLTSWSLLVKALLDILNNPVCIVAVITAFLGIWNDNSTKGLDGINKKGDDK